MNRWFGHGLLFGGNEFPGTNSISFFMTPHDDVSTSCLAVDPAPFAWRTCLPHRHRPCGGTLFDYMQYVAVCVWFLILSLAAVTVRLALATKRARPQHFFFKSQPLSSIAYLSLSSLSLLSLWSPRFSRPFSHFLSIFSSDLFSEKWWALPLLYSLLH